MGKAEEISMRIDGLEKAAAARAEGCRARMDAQSVQVAKLDKDLNGNGTPGIKTSLAHIEERVAAIESGVNVIKRLLFWGGGVAGGTVLTALVAHVLKGG